MKLLRDKRELTKVLLLFELTTNRYGTFKPLAEKFEITIQAISEYFKIMTDEGLMQKLDDVYKPTQQGVEFLHKNFSELREFVDNGIEKLAIVNKTVAIAGNKIARGDRVGLFMENGFLVAYKNRRSNSTGIAQTDSAADEEVEISDLDGIVSLKPGKITIISLPEIEQGGSKEVSLTKLKFKFEQLKPDLLGVKGVTGEIIARKLKFGNTIKYALGQGAMEATQHGLNVAILTSEEHCTDIKLELEKLNHDLINKIDIKIIKI